MLIKLAARARRGTENGGKKIGPRSESLIFFQKKTQKGIIMKKQGISLLF